MLFRSEIYVLFLFLSFNQMFPMAEDFDQSIRNIAQATHAAQQSNCLHLKLLRKTQSLLAQASQPLGYDSESRVQHNLITEQDVLTLLNDESEQFSGLIIDPIGQFVLRIYHIINNRQFDPFILSLDQLLQEPGNEPYYTMITDALNQIKEEFRRPVIIFNKLESFGLVPYQRLQVSDALCDFMRANQNPSISFIGITESSELMPRALYDQFTTSWLMPTMSFEQRRSLLERTMPYVENPQPVREMLNLIPLESMRKSLSRLSREQQVNSLAQQTEGFSSSALQTLVTQLRLYDPHPQEQQVDMAVKITAGTFKVHQTIGVMFLFKPLNWIARPSVWMRSAAFFSTNFSSGTREKLLILANRAQYGGRKPTISEFVSDYAPYVAPVLIRRLIGASPALIRYFTGK